MRSDARDVGPLRSCDGPLRGCDGPLRGCDRPLRGCDRPLRDCVDGPLRYAAVMGATHDRFQDVCRYAALPGSTGAKLFFEAQRATGRRPTSPATRVVVRVLSPFQNSDERRVLLPMLKILDEKLCAAGVRVEPQDVARSWPITRHGGRGLHAAQPQAADFLHVQRLKRRRAAAAAL